MKIPDPIFSGKIIDRKLRFVQREKDGIRRWIATFQDLADVEVIIRKIKKKRTNDQNAYYWGVVIPILSEYFGHDNREDMHTDLKEEFNPVESKLKPGKKIGGTTTKMSTVEFMASDTSYVERICRWAAMEHGVYIPPPKKADPE